MVIMDWAKLEQIGDAILGEYDRLYANAELIVWYLSSCTRRIHISRSVPQHYEIPKFCPLSELIIGLIGLEERASKGHYPRAARRHVLTSRPHHRRSHTRSLPFGRKKLKASVFEAYIGGVHQSYLNTVPNATVWSSQRPRDGLVTLAPRALAEWAFDLMRDEFGHS